MKRSDVYEAACIGLSVSGPNEAPWRFSRSNRRGRFPNREQMWEKYCLEWVKLAAQMNREMKDAGL